MAVLGDSAAKVGTVCKAPQRAKEPDLVMRAGTVLQARAVRLVKDFALQDPLQVKDLGLVISALTPRREQRHQLAHLALRIGTALQALLQT